jgi:DHA1 family inner membrane transport protein
MTASQTFLSDKSLRKKLFLPILGLAVFSVWLITVSFQLLLIDIAQTFQVQVGTASLVAAVGSISGVAAGLLMSVFSVRFNHKILLLIGLFCTSIAAVAFFFAPNFDLVLIPNIGVGAGIAIVTAMAYSLIAETYPLEKRGRAIGWMVASTALAYVIGAPVIGIIDSIGSWRLVMIVLALPFALASLALSFFVVPKISNQNPQAEKEPFFEGCKKAFSNKSAVAILFVTMFSMAEGSIGFYAVSFFRQQFSIGITAGSIVIVTGNILASVGGVIAGLLINRVGRKRLGTVTCLTAALLTLTFTLMPSFSLSWGLSALRFWFSGMSSTAGGSLVIEQLPKFRATMMSLNSVFMNFGMLLASISGVLAIDLYGYQSMALILGSFGIVGSIIWISIVRDPCKA